MYVEVRSDIYFYPTDTLISCGSRSCQDDKKMKTLRWFHVAETTCSGRLNMFRQNFECLSRFYNNLSNKKEYPPHEICPGSLILERCMHIRTTSHIVDSVVSAWESVMDAQTGSEQPERINEHSMHLEADRKTVNVRRYVSCSVRSVCLIRKVVGTTRESCISWCDSKRGLW